MSIPEVATNCCCAMDLETARRRRTNACLSPAGH